MRNTDKPWDNFNYKLFEQYLLAKKKTALIQIRTSPILKKDVQKALDKRNLKKGTNLTLTGIIEQHLLNFLENEK